MVEEQNENPDLPERAEKILKRVILSGLAGLIIPLLLGGYVFIRIQMLDAFEVTPEHLSPLLMAALYSFYILPASMVLAFIIAFCAGICVKRSLGFNLKESLKYGFAIPWFVLRLLNNTGV